MNCVTNRRTFLAAASGGCLALPFGLPHVAGAQTSGDETPHASAAFMFPPSFPSHEAGVAREIVGKSHRDLEAVAKLIEARPALAKAVWDWGFGDWESALGAASHVGRRDIAELLIAHGARPDIFTFAMFGELDAVKAIIAASPGIQRTAGPHGITLLAHAKAGGDEAASVVSYLESLGDADQAAANVPLDPEMRREMLGAYRYEHSSGIAEVDPRFTCEIIEQRNGMLAFKHLPDGSALNLFHQGSGQFHPAGAPKVRITFSQASLTIEDGALRVMAKKA